MRDIFAWIDTEMEERAYFVLAKRWRSSFISPFSCFYERLIGTFAKEQIKNSKGCRVVMCTP